MRKTAEPYEEKVVSPKKGPPDTHYRDVLERESEECRRNLKEELFKEVDRPGMRFSKASATIKNIKARLEYLKNRSALIEATPDI